MRSRRAQKRGGGFEITALDTDVRDPGAEEPELAQISDALDALDELAKVDPALAEIVDLKIPLRLFLR